MELQHRFEVPVGIDAAWTHLLDMEKVAACFPGATLSSADGDEYTGTVKVKLGPIQLTYAGKAQIVSTDEASHTAVIEASGNAARSGSTAAMKVTAVASAIGADRTAVEMATDLTITGKPAQFGRGVMVEVGNKILGKFADCLAGKLADAQAESSAAGAETASSADGKDAPPADGAPAAATAPTPAAEEPAAPKPPTFTRTPDMSEPIDLLESARGSIIKRLAPVAAALLVLLLWRGLRRRRRR